MVDEPHMRARLNELSIYSNIEGGIERQRSLFEAAERIEPKPKTFELLSSTADLAELSELAQDLDTSHFFHEMLDKLERTTAEAERRAARKGKPPKAFKAVIASGSSEQVYDWLTGLDEAPEIRAKVDWKAGRAGRVQVRFVAEFPLGLNDSERFRIMKLFCNSLSEDGMMVVGAIHSPDVTNDKRNYHLHVDAYDRPAAWLIEHGCWDFEYAIRRNGKTVFPLRQKKVRYAEPPAIIWRQRFIDKVELIRAGRPEITQFVHGTYEDNGIELAPLEHMGSRAISLEGRGVVTDIGLRNAERIWNDEKSAAERRAIRRLEKEIRQIEDFHPYIKHDADAVAASERYLELCHEKSARELQQELIDIEIHAARSRAETVIRTLTSTPGRPVRKREGDDQLLDQAKAHLASVEGRVPKSSERTKQGRIIAGLERKMNDLRPAILEAVASHLPGEHSEAKLSYVGRGSNAVQPFAKPSKFDERVRDRLFAWLKKNGRDRNCVIISKGTVRLGENVPKSIDTMMTKHWRNDRILRYLESERARRRALSMAAKLKYPALTGAMEGSLASVGLLQTVGGLNDAGVLRNLPTPTGLRSSSLRATRHLGETIGPNERTPDHDRSSRQVWNEVTTEQVRSETADELVVPPETHDGLANWEKGERKRTVLRDKRSAKTFATKIGKGAPAFPHFKGRAVADVAPQQVDEYLPFETALGPRYAKAADQSPAFLDRGDRIDLIASDDDGAILAAFKLAAVKFDCTIEIQGSEEFRERAFEVAQTKGLGAFLVDPDFVARRAGIENAHRGAFAGSSEAPKNESMTYDPDRISSNERMLDGQDPVLSPSDLQQASLTAEKDWVVPDHRADPLRMKLIEELVARLEKETHLPLIPQQGREAEGRSVLTFSLDLDLLHKMDPRLPLLGEVDRFGEDPAIQECFMRNHQKAIETAEQLFSAETGKGRERVRRLEFDRVWNPEPGLAAALILVRDTESVARMLDRLEGQWTRQDLAKAKRLEAEKLRRLEARRVGAAGSGAIKRSSEVNPPRERGSSSLGADTGRPELYRAKGPSDVEHLPSTPENDRGR